MSSKQYQLSNFKTNVTSQHGEDGIIKEIFNQIGTTSRLCIEFGAWDGRHLSNTWSLWADSQWAAILIEGDRERYKILTKRTENFSNVETINAYVSPEGADSLDNILKKKKIDKDIDLLSIDIDGDDFHIFESLSEHLPRCVVVEFNPTIPPEIDYVQPIGDYIGCSARALVRLAQSKGYAFVACTDTNCVFVLESQLKNSYIKPVELRDVFPYHHLTYVINSYNGDTFLTNTPTYTGYIKKRLYSKLFHAGRDSPNDRNKLIPVLIRR